MIDRQKAVSKTTTKSRISMMLKILGLIILLLFSAVFMIAYSVCGVTPEQQRENFLSHIHGNTPDPYKDCMKHYIDSHWEAVHDKYHQDIASGKYRAPRIQTDVVNDMIREYLLQCENSL